MDARYLAYLQADPDFYRELWSADEPRSGRLGPYPAPPQWQVHTRGPWVVYLPPRDVPRSGWKIHASCPPGMADDVVGRVVSAGVAAGVPLKHLRSEQLVHATQAKYAAPEAAGKLAVLYPTDGSELQRLLGRLCVELAGVPGARVLSDVPVEGAPLGLRFGAFLGAPRLDADGRLRPGRTDGALVLPDDRSAHAQQACADETPQMVARLIAAADERDREAVLPCEGVRVLHRSNAGGVYSAIWRGRTPAVLKEARHHTGYDRGGADAVTRLRHEHAALCRLRGLGVAPEPIEYLTVGDSDFLVMEHIDGIGVGAVLATRHPGVVPDAHGLDFKQWVEDVVARTRTALETCHRHQVVHLDVHPGNVIERNGEMVLIDFESCAIDGAAVADGVCSPLSEPDGTEPADDFASLERMRAMLLNPSYSLTRRRPELATPLLVAAEEDLGERAGQPDEGALPRLRERLINGIRVIAEESSAGRRFPGDIEAFGSPGAELGLLYGAAGVLTSLALSGSMVPDDWITDFRRQALEAPALSPTLGHGAAGIAVCLARLGYPEEADVLLDRARTQAAALSTPWWSGGLAGLAVAAAELCDEQHSGEYDARWAGWSEALMRAVWADRTPQRYRPGLLSGWSGVSLALLRIAEVAGGEHAGRLREAALTAAQRDLAETQERAGALLTLDGRRLMPYVGTGSAALALAADACRAAGMFGRGFDPDRVIAGVRVAISMPTVACAGLLHGRAGLAATLSRLGPGSMAAARHRARLAWYTLPVDLSRRSHRREHPLAAEADFVLGEQNLRASTDLATGAAGVLIALADDDAFARSLLLPAATRDDRSQLSALTCRTSGRRGRDEDFKVTGPSPAPGTRSDDRGTQEKVRREVGRE